MPGKTYAKVILNGTTYMDLTADTVAAASLLRGTTAHDHAGAAITGTCDYDVDSSNCTALVGEILDGKTAAVGGSVIVGTMPNRGAVTGTISTVSGTYTIPQGCHDGSGTVSILATEQAKIIAGNIKSGVEILGVTGTYTGEAITAQTKSNIVPLWTAQQITPDDGYDYLAEVDVAAITITETALGTGGYCVSI